MKKLAAIFMLAAFLMPALPQTGHAQDWHRGRHGHGDIRRFNARDMHYWHSGHWFHGSHGGRGGWWWVLGNSFYLYPSPIYPYPDPFVPPTVVVASSLPGPIVTPVPVTTYYFCHYPRGYYPYVQACYRPWRAVTAY